MVGKTVVMLGSFLMLAHSLLSYGLHKKMLLSKHVSLMLHLLYFRIIKFFWDASFFHYLLVVQVQHAHV
ncbi:hypothetical protein BC833DRAFT_613621 [Globomyces pollinis-pini]|nr:hypothetical protein BC833DRAFT_613621 [Globomyces pollinis-pini]